MCTLSVQYASAQCALHGPRIMDACLLACIRNGTDMVAAVGLGPAAAAAAPVWLRLFGFPKNEK